MAGASFCTGAICNTTGDCCRVAGAGFGLSADGTSCGACPAGQFKSDAGAGLCSLCPSGQYSGVEGATSDTVCTICGGFTNAAQSTCSGGGMQWVLGSWGSQSCDAVCWSQGTAMTCYGAAAFKEVTSLAYFEDNVNNGQLGCSGGTSSSSWSYAPYQSSSSCYQGGGGTCGASSSSRTRFCPCACPAGKYSSTGSTAACQS